MEIVDKRTDKSVFYRWDVFVETSTGNARKFGSDFPANFDISSDECGDTSGEVSITWEIIDSNDYVLIRETEEFASSKL